MREKVLLLMAACIGGILFVITFKASEPATQLELQVDRYDAWRIADAFMAQAGYDLGEYERENAAFFAHNDILAFLQQHRIESPEERSELLRFRPLGRWDLLYVRPSDGDRLRFKISPDGKIFEGARTPPTGTPSGSSTASTTPSDGIR